MTEVARALFSRACAEPARPGLRVEVDGPDRFRLAQGERTVLTAAVDRGLTGVDLTRTEPYRSPLPPLRADTARALHPDPDGARWAHRFAALLTRNPLGPLHTGDWLFTAHTPYDTEVLGFEYPDDDVDWFGWTWHGGRVLMLDELRHIPLLPLRRPSETDHPRVKSYRRQAREGVLPPVLAWWVSGLFTLAVLDGHDRLAAALAEERSPRIVTVGLAVSDAVVDTEVSRAVRTYGTAVDLAARHPFADALGAADRRLTATVTAAAHRFGPTRAFTGHD